MINLNRIAMVVFPHSKINIGLYVTDRRGDGYHNIETLFYPLGLSDVLEAVVNPVDPHGRPEFAVSGMEIEGPVESNLVLKACWLLEKRAGLTGLMIHLHKCIPMGAGLGGGSSDGAFMLLLLNRLLNAGLTPGELHDLALELGSDCPFFMVTGPRFARGRGEELTPAPVSLKGLHLQLYHPGTGISTALAYRNVQVGPPDRPIEELASLPMEKWRDSLRNVFEPYAFEQLPVLAQIRDELYRHGSIYTSMTGSGSAMYGLFESEKEAPPSIARYLVWKEELRH